MCGDHVSKEALCPAGHYAAGFGANTWPGYGRYDTRILCCAAQLPQETYRWQYTDQCGHGCGEGVDQETVCGPGRYNTRIYCCLP